MHEIVDPKEGRQTIISAKPPREERRPPRHGDPVTSGMIADPDPSPAYVQVINVGEAERRYQLQKALENGEQAVVYGGIGHVHPL